MESKKGKMRLFINMKMKWLRFYSLKAFKWVCAGVLTFLAILVLGMASGESREVLVVSTEEVKVGGLERILTATGIIKPEEGAEVKTRTRVAGVIKTL